MNKLKLSKIRNLAYSKASEILESGKIITHEILDELEISLQSKDDVKVREVLVSTILEHFGITAFGVEHNVPPLKVSTDKTIKQTLKDIAKRE
ncbi:hypothetical protein TH1_176 [Shewanella phage Thanatos-1]|nr:hypothetical protein TH1_176 [Shewanella phage Thanatos-1]QLA10729.1 hypothetical protein TH2_163 [Shewanella phage Thanatos-2]